MKKKNQNEKKFTGLYDIEHLLILISTVTRCLFISSFAFWVGIPKGIIGSTIRLSICVTTWEVRKYKSMIKKKRRSMKKY